jgi:hypothetical protein
MPIPFLPVARLLTRALHPVPSVDLSAVESFVSRMGQEGQGQGVLITVNHYSAPDFQAWWFVILISAVFPVEIHWVVTSAWTNSGWLTGFTHWLFPRGAKLLGFTPMPVMPPDPAEAEERAMAVLKVLHYAMHTPMPVIGMAPEGGDMPGGVLGKLPPGAGRFMHLLSETCPKVLPVGVWKDRGRIYLKFGSPYQLEVPVRLSAQARDKSVAETVMHHIALCLPERLRGEYK